ncbi:hypothetical protein BDB00DRAFT_849257 [Zychaea mexicana]|uniref:uncharacterized protein n=1 Tax=Zychaea mexicana TaxID=64656 RepID=UPI0022FE2D0C|nr:uncharacterized protein BDB00DRAFT_849257 [Zychaea mexicana]KAI9488268.1 hypothetical protein BDB00DRAFT_849257 [Zychaea mexicana]
MTFLAVSYFALTRAHTNISFVNKTLSLMRQAKCVSVRLKCIVTDRVVLGLIYVIIDLKQCTFVQSLMTTCATHEI